MSEQGTSEWLSERAGKVTASMFTNIMMKPSTAGYQSYQGQLIAEQLTGIPHEGYTNSYMAWGTETEPQARAMYELETGNTVDEVGFINHPFIKNSGASPDGLIGDDGLVEIKCPATHTHIKTLTGAPIDKKYIMQMQWQMTCTGAKWCDFVSFDPRISESMRIHITRVERDDKLIAEMEAAASDFLAEIDATLAQLRDKYETQKEAA